MVSKGFVVTAAEGTGECLSLAILSAEAALGWPWAGLLSLLSVHQTTHCPVQHPAQGDENSRNQPGCFVTSLEVSRQLPPLPCS